MIRVPSEREGASRSGFPDFMRDLAPQKRGVSGGSSYGTVTRRVLKLPGVPLAALPYHDSPLAKESSRMRVPLEGYGRALDVELVGEMFQTTRLSSLMRMCDAQDAIKKIASSVVFIRGSKGSNGWSGSGVVVDGGDLLKRGIDISSYPAGAQFILTNDHVEGDADGLYVTLPDGTEVSAKAALSSRKTRFEDKIGDVALLVIEPGRRIPAADIGKSSDLKIGERIYAAGHPHGLPSLVVTGGLVTQPKQWTGEPIPGIQTDAAINPGNSGGPMFNDRGEVVGLNTYGFRGADNTGFAMPIDAQLSILARISQNGKMVRGKIPVVFKSLTLKQRIELGITKKNGFPDTTGAIVKSVGEYSEAWAKDLKVGDLVTSIDVVDDKGKVVRSYDVNVHNGFLKGRLQGFIQGLKPGTKIVLNAYHRKGKGKNVKWSKMDKIAITVKEL